MLFTKNKHREFFLKLLAEMSDRFGVRILAYCLMGNHYHLLLNTPGPGLSEGMKHLSGSYTRYFNRDQRVDGALFRGRFKSIVISADDYLVEVSRYIHRNPVEAGLVKIPAEYAWSSFSNYLDEGTRLPWLITKDVLGRVGPNPVESYRRFVDNPHLISMRDFYNSPRLPGVLGSKQFREHISGLGFKHESAKNKAVSSPEVGQVIEIVAQYFQVSPRALTLKAPGKKATPRLVAMYVAKRKCEKTAAEIAAHFGVARASASGLMCRFQKALGTDKKARDAILMIESVLDEEKK